MKTRIIPMKYSEAFPFEDENYVFGLNPEGMRCIVAITKTGVLINDKKGKNITGLFPEFSALYEDIPNPCILDGEIAVLSRGAPDPLTLGIRTRLKSRNKIALISCLKPAHCYVSDIINLCGKSLINVPFYERIAILNQSIAENTLISITGYAAHNGLTLLNCAGEYGLVGVTARRKDSLYYPGQVSEDCFRFVPPKL